MLHLNHHLAGCRFLAAFRGHDVLGAQPRHQALSRLRYPRQAYQIPPRCHLPLALPENRSGVHQRLWLGHNHTKPRILLNHLFGTVTEWMRRSAQYRLRDRV